MKVSELEGAELDYWVALAGECWKWAHELFPTMTIDPTFIGCKFHTFSGGNPNCLLVPRNPMRQDHRVFAPSSEWGHGGPVAEKYRIELHIDSAINGAQLWTAYCGSNDGEGLGPTPLIAAMRALVASKFGKDVPDRAAPIDPRTELERRADEEAEMARMELSAHVAAQEPVAQKLIGWRTYDYLQETSDPEKALNWSSAVGVLPVFEGDPNTKLEGRSAAPVAQEPVGTLECHVSGKATFWPDDAKVFDLPVGDHPLYAAPVAAQAQPDHSAGVSKMVGPDDHVEQPLNMVEPVAVLRYERGTPGSENEMPTVVSCNWMPDGEYRVYLGHDAAQAPPDQFRGATEMIGGNSGELDEREAFEAHFSQPPFEWEFHRYGGDSAWPGNYQNYDHQCAWEAWQARAAIAKARGAP